MNRQRLMAKKSAKNLSGFQDLNAGMILKNLPFILFLGLLATVYIANAHYSEKKVRQIQQLQNEVKELRWNYMSMKSELMYNSKRSQVVKEAEALGLGVSRSGIRKIVVDSKKSN